MLIINTSTVVVYTAQELKTALEGNNGYTYIYFGANIKLVTGITVSRYKENVIIDGTYQNIRYQYEDMSSLGSGDTISVRSASNQLVTLKNIDVLGHNYYGIIYVPESTNLKDVIIEYVNLTYQGPQITYHPVGLSRYIDCDITILTSYGTANEVAECNRIEIGGHTTIDHTSTGDSMFWFRGNTTSYFKVLTEAVVTITSQYRELFYGINNLEFSVLKNASFQLDSHNGMGYNGYSTGNVLLDTGCRVSITQTARNGGYATWYCTGSFIMNESSSLTILSNYSGISSTNYNLYFRSTASSLIFHNPAYLLLYNSSADVIYTDSTISFSFSFSRINMWTRAENLDIAGTIQDLPNYYWYKQYGLSTISGTISSSATTISNNNYTSEELSLLFALSNFKFQGKKVLSIGTTELMINAISDTDLEITGQAVPFSDVQLSYDDTILKVQADSLGDFSFRLSSFLPVGTTLSFISNVARSFLYKNKSVQIVYEGELVLEQSSQTIMFSTTPFQTDPILCARSEPISITISDSRLHSTKWKLYASILAPLSSENGNILTDSLVYVSSISEIFPLNQELTLVYEGEENRGVVKITNVTFPEDQGILLRVMNEPMKNGVIYSTTIIWTLTE